MADGIKRKHLIWAAAVLAVLFAGFMYCGQVKADEPCVVMNCTSSIPSVCTCVDPKAAADPCSLAKDGPTVAEQVAAELAADCEKAKKKAEKKAAKEAEAIAKAGRPSTFQKVLERMEGEIGAGTGDGNLAVLMGLKYRLPNGIGVGLTGTTVDLDDREVQGCKKTTTIPGGDGDALFLTVSIPFSFK